MMTHYYLLLWKKNTYLNNWVGFFFLVTIFNLINLQAVLAQCTNISPNVPCNQVAVSSPYNITFNGTEGGIIAQTATPLGTGFRMVQAPSGTREAADMPIFDANFPGYEPNKLLVTNGELRITSTKGGAFLTANNQLNTLGVGYKGANKEFNIETNLINLNTGGSSAQAGLWYGLDDKSFAKLVITNNNQIEFRIERNDVSGNADRFQVTNLVGIGANTVKLRLLVNNKVSPQKIQAYYKIGNDNERFVGEFTHDFGNGVTIGSETGVSFAGIFASYRANTVAFTARFADFSLADALGTLTFNPGTQNLSVLQNEVKTFSVDLNTSDGSSPTVNFSAKDLNNNVPAWLKINNNILDGTVTQNLVSSEVVFTVDASGLNVGNYGATVKASNAGFTDGILQVEVIVQDLNSPNPYVISVNPPNGTININPIGVGVSANQLYFPPGFDLDKTSVNNTNVKLFRLNASNQEVEDVPSNVNDTGGGDAINLAPTVDLQPNTKYRFRVTAGVLTKNASNEVRPFIAYSSEFTTGDPVSGTGDLSDVAFTKVEGTSLGAQTTGRFSSLVKGPDGKLYASNIDGTIRRWTINPDGTLSSPETFSPALTDKDGVVAPRIIIGLAFDPASTPANMTMYISHSTSFDLGEGPDWDGKITRLRGANFTDIKDVVVRLPRATKDHLTNSIAFGPDGMMYFNQGSQSAGGAYDGAWKRDETLLAGAVLRLDFSKMPPENQWPLNVQTTATLSVINSAPSASFIMSDGTYNPYASNSPLTIYASGLRNAYDLVWHTNGELYVPTNGTAGGSNTPASINGTRRPDGTFYNTALPQFPTVPTTFGNEVQRDWLFKVQQGKYYGHPNPLRGEFVLNRGKIDVAKYPAGMTADVNYGGASFDFEFNKSPNGVIEYKSEAFNGKLKGKLLVARFSLGDDLIVLEPGGTSKNIIANFTGITGLTGFIDPLDLTEDPATGNIYVSQYDRDAYPNLGASKIILLKPNAPAGISVNPLTIYTNDPQGGGAGTNQTITIRNTGSDVLQVSGISLSGTDATQFTLIGLPTFPIVIPANGTTTFNVAFNPTTTGLKLAKVLINSNAPSAPTVEVNLRGLGTLGLGGNNEPSLQAIFDLFNTPVNVGDTDPTTNTINTANTPDAYNGLLGQEIALPKFEKVGNGNVIIEPLAVFGPTTNNPVVGMGWYNSDFPGTLNELFTVTNTPTSNGQTVNVNVTGNLSFDPGAGIPFGFFSRWPFFADRHIYSDDALNTFDSVVQHHVRVYPYKNANGVNVANTYIVAFEENTSGYDYQDIVFIVKNVKPYVATITERLNFTPNTKSLLLSSNTLGVFKHKLETTDSKDAMVSLAVQYTDGNGWLKPSDFDWNTPFGYQFANPDISFNVATQGLVPGVYRAKITATANNYISGVLNIEVVISNTTALPSYNINFQNLATTPPANWLRDSGEPYGARTGANQGTGLKYGWLRQDDGTTALNLANNGRARGGTDVVKRTLMHMQYTGAVAGGNTTPGLWEMDIPNGYYNVTVQAGDTSITANTNNPMNSTHILNVEGIKVLEFNAPTPAGTARIRSGSTQVLIKDGKLTIDAKGGINTKIVSAVITPISRTLAINPNTINIIIDEGEVINPQNITVTANTGDILDLTLTKSIGAPWLKIPLTVSPGSNQLTFDATGLSSGVYDATITATASGYTSASIPVRLTVRAKSLSFSTNTLNYVVAQGGSTQPQTVTLNSGGVVTPIKLTLSKSATWLVLPNNPITGDLSFGVNSGGLAPGDYSVQVVAETPALGQAALTINLKVQKSNFVIASNAWDYKINFQTTNPAIPTGFTHIDDGSAFGLRANGLTYGWFDNVTKLPRSNTAQARLRSPTTYPNVPLELRTFNQLQVPRLEAFWQINIPNGRYYAKVSVGDIESFDSFHVINLNGKKVVEFNQAVTGVGGFKQDSMEVEITNGKLVIDSYTGTNTKINYIWLEPLNPANDNAPPTISLTFDGVQQAPDTYRNPLNIIANVSDLGGSGVASVQYSINNGPYVNYQNLIKVVDDGDYKISVKARDGNNNESTTPYIPFKVITVAPTGAGMDLENAYQKFPNAENYTFSWVQSIGRNYYQSDSNIVRIHNRGVANLIVNDLILTDNQNFKIDAIGGVKVTPQNFRGFFPLTISSNNFVDIEVLFTARRKDLTQAQRIIIYHEKLTIISNDDFFPVKSVNLHAIYQEQDEGMNEPYAFETMEACGFKSKTGFGIVNNNHKTPMEDEIFSPYFVLANATLPNTNIGMKVRQLGAYHTLGQEEAIRYRLKGSTGDGIAIFFHTNASSQSLLPPRRVGPLGSTTQDVGEAANFRPQAGANPPFALRISTDDTDPFENTFYRTLPQLAVDAGGNPFRGARVWIARDWNGKIIPNAYVVSHDYLRGNLIEGVISNFDYNDNLYYVENIRPEVGTAYYSELSAGTNQSSLNFNNVAINTTVTQTIDLLSLGKTYPSGPSDPDIRIEKIEIRGGNSSDFSYTMPAKLILGPNETTQMTISFNPKLAGVKNAELLVYYDLTRPLRIPLYGVATSPCYNITLVKRIKAPAANNNPIVLYGKTWESHRLYMTNLADQKIDYLGTPTSIASTDEDLVYSSQLSTTTDFRPINFEIKNLPNTNLPNGDYIVRLHFAENTFLHRRQRVNAVIIEGKVVYPDLDIVDEVGFKQALTKDFPVNLTDGRINISIVPSVNRVAISGIEVFRVVNLSNLVLNSTQIVGANCGVQNGAITLQGANATPNTPLLYRMGANGPEQSSGTFTGLEPGTYTFYVRENRTDGCEAKKTFTIPSINANINFEIVTTPVVCGTPASGTAKVENISGGTGPYLVTWSTNPVKKTNYVTGLAVGTYQVTVTDALGCSLTQNVTINACGSGPNNAPIIVNPLPDVVVFKNNSQIIVNLNGAFSDFETQQLTYSVTSNTNTALIQAEVSGKFLLLTFTKDAVGNGDITIRATDAGGLFIEDTFNVKVLGFNVVVNQVDRPVLKGGVGKAILGIKIDNPGGAIANNFIFKTTGTNFVGNIINAKLYRTTRPVFFNPIQLGTTVVSPNGQFSFTNLNYNLVDNANYFWLAYDISTNAAIGDVVDAEFVSVNLSGTESIAVNGNPEGNREIVAIDEIPGRALELDGVDDVVDIQDEGYFDFTNAFTAEAWIRVKQFNKNNEAIISKGDAWGIRREGTTDQISFYINGIGTVTGLTNVNDNQWHHIAAVFNGTQLRLYVDGWLDGEINAVGTPILNNRNVRLGGNPQTAGLNFNGVIDEVRFWSIARSEQNIRERMHLTLKGNETGLMGYFQLNETTGLSAFDLVNGLLGNLLGNMTDANWVSSPVPIGNGVAFTANSVANGAVNFTNTGLLINFGTNHPQGALVVTRIDNVGPAGDDPAPGDNKSASYWIINNFGNKTGLSQMQLTFSLPSGFLLSANPAAYKLYKRPTNGFLGWADNFTAIAVDLNANTITFGGITSFSQALISGSGIGLPVTWTSFNGRRISATKNELTWGVALQKQNKGFEVYKSLDGNTFQVIGFVKGDGDLLQARTFKFVDENEMNTAYYRVKQIDENGDSSYHPFIVRIAGANEDFVNVFPNPLSDGAVLQIESSDNIQKINNIIIEILDSQGRIVWQNKGNLNDLKEDINRYLPNISDGFYLIRITANRKQFFTKLIKN
jgi:glucose/arabinose dehydrogenase